MDKHIDRLNMIKHLYQVAIDPMAYEDLVDEWAKVIHSAMVAGEEDLYDVELAEHIVRAGEIFNRLDKTHGAPMVMPLAKAIELDPNPAILLDKNGYIVGANTLAGELLGARSGQPLSVLFSKQGHPPAKFQDLLEKLTAKESGVAGFLQLDSTNDHKALLLVLSHVTCVEDTRIVGILTNLAPIWSARTTEAVQEHFDLTSAETDIVQKLVNGKNVNQISHDRGTSVHTIRTQIKSVLAKTDMVTQLELVRHISFLQRFERPGAQYFPASACNHKTEFGATHHSLTLKSGRSLEYMLVGPPKGKPALFLHGMLDGTVFAREFIDQLFERNILLIAPSRPGHGNSDPYLDNSRVTSLFPDIIAQLLDSLNIEKLPVFSNMAGFYYGVLFAGTHAARVSAILGIACVLPITSREQLSQMSPSHRLVSSTANNSPGLLTLFIKAGIATVRSGNENLITNLAYKFSRSDFELSKQPETRAILHRRYHFLSKQGHSAFSVDAKQISCDWRGLINSVSCPITLIHGTEDFVFKVNAVREMAGKIKNCKLIEIENAGQLLLNAQPDVVLDQLDEVFSMSD